jgi:hypothetical protein
MGWIHLNNRFNSFFVFLWELSAFVAKPMISAYEN